MDVNIGEIYAGILSPRSLSSYEREWKNYTRYVEDKGINANDPDALRAYRTYLIDETNYKVTALNSRLRIIRAIFSMFAKREIISKQTGYLFREVPLVRPSSLPERSKVKRNRISPAEMREIMDRTRVDPHNPLPNLERALLLTLATSGMRAAELSRVRVEDVVKDPAGHCIENVMAKGKNEARTVPISGEAYEAIMDWLYVRPIQSNYVFTHTVSEFGQLLWRRTAITPKRIWEIVKKYAAKIDRPELSPHDFRRFVGTTLAADNIRVAQKVLGHSDISMTARYYVLDQAPLGVTEGMF